MVSNQQLFDKLVSLDPAQQQIAYEFIDFLLSKRAKKNPVKNPVKKKSKNEFLLQTSVWSDEDIQPIEDARKAINAWIPATW